MNLLNKVAIFLIKLYQKFVSPILGKHCRFTPTCSEYAVQAFKKYNIFKASFLVIKRILKCNPLFPGGYDPLK